MSHTGKHQLLVLSLGLYVGVLDDLCVVNERVEGGAFTHALDESGLHCERTSGILVLDDLYLLVLTIF